MMNWGADRQLNGLRRITKKLLAAAAAGGLRPNRPRARRGGDENRLGRRKLSLETSGLGRFSNF